jgi:uncharacterized membrane protein
MHDSPMNHRPMNKLTRLLRHRWFDERDTAKAFGSEALARIEARVQASERGHTGELRVFVEAGLPLSYLWRGATARERALTLFGKLRVWDTEQNNGVLVYLLLAEHRIEIVADRAVSRVVEEGHWAGIVSQMAEAFRAGRYEAGLLAALDAVDSVLRQHFPRAEGAPDINELPDRPVLR